MCACAFKSKLTVTPASHRSFPPGLPFSWHNGLLPRNGARCDPRADAAAGAAGAAGRQGALSPAAGVLHLSRVRRRQGERTRAAQFVRLCARMCMCERMKGGGEEKDGEAEVKEKEERGKRK